MFLTRAEEAYNQAKFYDQAKFGLIREAFKSPQLLLQFVLFRGAKDYREQKRYFADQAEN